jgi:hypothetical protein
MSPVKYEMDFYISRDKFLIVTAVKTSNISFLYEVLSGKW